MPARMGLKKTQEEPQKPKIKPQVAERINAFRDRSKGLGLRMKEKLLHRSGKQLEEKFDFDAGYSLFGYNRLLLSGMIFFKHCAFYVLWFDRANRGRR